MLAVFAALLGYAAVTRSLAEALAASNAELAHRLAPGNGRITARLARSLSGSDASIADRRRANGLARQALRQDATAIAAASTLGINAQIRNDTASARRLMTYAQQLSRRDLPTQIWAIEDMVARGDVAGALRHHDIALRIRPTISELLFPILTAASADPRIRPALVRTLAGRPPWSYRFLYYVAAQGPDPRATVQLFDGLRRVGVAIPEGADARVINALIAGGRIDEAWDRYTLTRPAADRLRSRDPRFTAAVEAATRFDWITINRDGINAAIQSDGAGGVFDFAAPAGIGGAVLEQMQLLPPGDYRLVGRSGGIDQAVRAAPYWILTCRDGRELGRLVLPNSVDAGGVFAGRLRVPTGCPVQILTLTARPSDAVSGVGGQIYQAQLSTLR